MKNNLYWIKNSETPCVCLGLELPSSTGNQQGPSRQGSSSGGSRDSLVPLIKIFPINCSAPMRQVSVLPTTIEPLDVNILTHCHDPRTVDFTLAMMKFAEWEMNSNPEIGRRWYSYPSFIMSLIAHSHEWSTWRKQVLRSAKGKMSIPKGTLFFESLVSEYENFYRMTDYNRCIDADVPWDDSPIIPETPAHTLAKEMTPENIAVETISPDSKVSEGEFLETCEESKEDNRIIFKPHSEQDCLKSTKKTKAAREPKIPKEAKTAKEPKSNRKKPSVVVQKPLNRSGLYWLTRHSLPCIRLAGDVPIAPSLVEVKSSAEAVPAAREKDPEEHFRGQPVCCSTYHYEVNVTGAVEELNSENLKICNDERTIDFTNALIDFQRWDIGRRKRLSANDSTAVTPEPDSVQTDVSLGDASQHPAQSAVVDAQDLANRMLESNNRSDDLTKPPDGVLDAQSRYIWPEFILELITHPREWAVWRKKCERLVSVNQKRDGRREQYFEALKNQQIQLDSENASYGSPVSTFNAGCSGDAKLEPIPESQASTPQQGLFSYSKNILQIANSAGSDGKRKNANGGYAVPDSLQMLSSR